MAPAPVVQQPEHGGIRLAIVFFGFFCLLTGYLIFKSTFLPRVIAVLMMIAGLAWLSFLSPPFGAKYFPDRRYRGRGTGVVAAHNRREC